MRDFIYRHKKTESQEELLKLLKEIDSICRENDIQYYLDSGTALGAFRHGGFIPWDDDADLAMTWENYKKFEQAVNAGTVETKRIVVNSKSVPEQINVFGRYVNLENTKIVQSCQFWNEDAPAGQVIDIFILLPVPRGEEAEFINLYTVYDEFQNEITRHRAGRTDEFIALYKEMQKRSQTEGRDAVVREMEARLFDRDVQEFDLYLYTTGGKRQALTMPREWFEGETRYYEFEDCRLPLAPRFIEKFRMEYGDDYWIMMQTGNFKIHSDLHSAAVPAKCYIRDYMRFLNKDEVLDHRKKFKDIKVLEGWKEKESIEKIYAFESFRVARSIKSRIERENLDIQALLDSHEGSVLSDLFSEYYQKQFSSAYIYWAYIIDLPEDIMRVALLNYIEQFNGFGKVSKFFHRYREVRGEIKGALKDVEDLLDTCFYMQARFDYGEYDEGRKLLDLAEQKYSHLKCVKIGRVKYDAHDAISKDDIYRCRARIDELLTKYENDPELIKYLGDTYWKQGDEEKAFALYERSYPDLKNGTLRLDIENKVKGAMSC
ncbi:MAG: LicD family protein [Bacillota bacterium]|nr:LicD family protein [Bacillota bacterium]